MEEILFLDIDDVLELHRIALERYGGQPGVRDQHLLLSAIYQPQQTFGGQSLYKSIPAMPAVYAYHLTENQPFMDGNERTAFAASVVFLKLNGYALHARNDEVYQLFIDLANKKVTKEDMGSWYERKVHKEPG